MDRQHTCEPTCIQVPNGSSENDELNAAWHEVGIQLQGLCTRLAVSLQQSWTATGNEANATHTLQGLRDDLRVAADRVDQAIRDVSDATHDDRTETLRATRRASEQSLEQARILTAATLRKLNRQLDHLVERMDSNDTGSLRQRPDS